MQQLAQHQLCSPALFGTGIRLTPAGTVDMVQKPRVPSASHTSTEAGPDKADDPAFEAAAPDRRDDLFHALVWEKFWSEMLPSLERHWASATIGRARGRCVPLESQTSHQ